MRQQEKPSTRYRKSDFYRLTRSNEDPARAELDQRLIVDVLGLSHDLCAAGGPMERLRAKLAVEPQIHSNKRTRVAFTETGESTARRNTTSNQPR